MNRPTVVGIVVFSALCIADTVALCCGLLSVGDWINGLVAIGTIAAATAAAWAAAVALWAADDERKRLTEERASLARHAACYLRSDVIALRKGLEKFSELLRSAANDPTVLDSRETRAAIIQTLEILKGAVDRLEFNRLAALPNNVAPGVLDAAGTVPAILLGANLSFCRDEWRQLRHEDWNAKVSIWVNGCDFISTGLKPFFDYVEAEFPDSMGAP